MSYAYTVSHFSVGGSEMCRCLGRSFIESKLYGIFFVGGAGRNEWWFIDDDDDDDDDDDVDDDDDDVVVVVANG